MNLQTRSVPQPQSDARYDRTTIVLHWIVVVFVIGLYAALAEAGLVRG